MDHRRRHRLALLASLLAHGLALGGFSFGLNLFPQFDVPDLDFEFTEIELLDPDAIQGESPATEPEPPAPQPPAAPPAVAEDPQSEPGQPEPEPEPKRFADKGSRADQLAPTSSTFHMLLVPKKIRRLPFAQQVLDIMAPLPDFEYLIDKGRFDPLRDFEHIVIASPDIRDWTQTFLAVDFRLPPQQVQRAIERAAAANDEVIEWIDDGGLLRGNPRPRNPEQRDVDRRWFVFLERNVAIYVREEFLPNILAGPGDDERKTAGNFVANLAKLRRFAARQPNAGMQLVVRDIRRNLKNNPLPFQIPDEFEISVSASTEPEVVIRGKFANMVEAKAFTRWWADELSTMIDQSFALKLQIGWVYDLFELERDAQVIHLRATLTRGQAEKIMQFAADGSRKVAGKTPEQVEQMRQRRREAWDARQKGKLPPSALEPSAEPSPGLPHPQAEPRNKTGPSRDTPIATPNKTPNNAGGEGRVGDSIAPERGTG